MLTALVNILVKMTKLDILPDDALQTIITYCSSMTILQLPFVPIMRDVLTPECYEMLIRHRWPNRYQRYHALLPKQSISFRHEFVNLVFLLRKTDAMIAYVMHHEDLAHLSMNSKRGYASCIRSILGGKNYRIDAFSLPTDPIDALQYVWNHHMEVLDAMKKCDHGKNKHAVRLYLRILDPSTVTFEWSGSSPSSSLH